MLQTLIGIANGTAKVQRNPAVFRGMIFHTFQQDTQGNTIGDFYEVAGVEGKMTPAEFELWRSRYTTVKGMVMVLYDQEPTNTQTINTEIEYIEPVVVNREAEIVEPTRKPKRKGKPKEAPEIAPLQVVPKPEIEIPTTGLMSEYGKTWRFSWSTQPLDN